MTHLDHCLDELEAELDALLAEDASVRALAQLDAREARGEVLDVVDTQLLRRHLEQAIAANPAMCSKAKLAALRFSLTGGTTATSAETAVTAEEPTGKSAEIVAFAPMKAAAAGRRSAVARSFARAAAVTIALASAAAISTAPSYTHDAVAEISSQAHTSVPGMLCVVLGCHIAAALR